MRVLTSACRALHNARRELAGVELPAIQERLINWESSDVEYRFGISNFVVIRMPGPRETLRCDFIQHCVLQQVAEGPNPVFTDAASFIGDRCRPITPINPSI